MDKDKGGRPSKINEEKIEEIANLIRAGNYIETAAQYAGISKPTLYLWLKRGALEKDRVAKNTRHRIRQEDALHVKFSNAVKEALAEAEIRDVTNITRAGQDGAWQASAWRLERKFPDRWGRKPIVEVSGPNGGPIQHEHEHREVESKEEKFERLFAAIDEYRADVDVPDSGAGEGEPLDTYSPNGKTT